MSKNRNKSNHNFQNVNIAVEETIDTPDVKIDSCTLANNIVASEENILVENTAEDDVVKEVVDAEFSKDIDILETTESVDTKNIAEKNHENDPVRSIDSDVISVATTSFYKVGTDMIGGKCIAQATSTTDLVKAKEVCDNSRDTYKKSYHVFDKDGNAVYTAEYSVPKDNYYRVGTDWKSSKCINQKFTSVDRDQSENYANEVTKTTGIVHNVYDPTGKVIFSAKKKLTLLALKKRR